MNSLTSILGSKSRASLFALLFDQPGKELYLRELHRESGLSLRPIQQELNKLEKIGLIKTRKDGNRLYYSANTAHPIFPEIRSLVEKTMGFRALLTEALTGHEINLAFIFGSVASDKARPESDLDLFVVGGLGLRNLTKLLSGLSERIGREINPHSMTLSEFKKRLSSKDHFITSVAGSEKTFIIGDENELRALGKK
ncbi:MAG: nucleotidyltransferase domain-containing protein [Bdellovibrionales bacterium]|nr:nucleotidyltransferase domain-containing protein [Bdellovibrionales bacterium]